MHSWWLRVAMTGLSRGMAILERLHPVNLHERTAQWRQEGWTGSDANARTSSQQRRGPRRPATRVADRGASTRRIEGDKEVTIPVWKKISPSAHGKSSAVTCAPSQVTEQPVEESVRLREEKVTVERRPVDRPATEADFAAAGKDVIEMTEKAEEPVVTKRARVVEEVVVHKDVTEHTETVEGPSDTPTWTSSGAGDRDGDQARHDPGLCDL